MDVSVVGGQWSEEEKSFSHELTRMGNTNRNVSDLYLIRVFVRVHSWLKPLVPSSWPFSFVAKRHATTSNLPDSNSDWNHDPPITSHSADNVAIRRYRRYRERIEASASSSTGSSGRSYFATSRRIRWVDQRDQGSGMAVRRCSKTVRSFCDQTDQNDIPNAELIAATASVDAVPVCSTIHTSTR